jgi:hypothetical protein
MSIRFLIKILLIAILASGRGQLAPAQDPVQIRYTLSTGSATGTVSVNGKKWYALQSIGQSSVIGSFTKGELVLHQGFLQPYSLIVVSHDLPEFKADVYPNPFVNSFSISFAEEILNSLTVTLFDIDGKVLYSGRFAPSQKITINNGDLPPGFYIIKILNGQRQFTQRVIKK